MYQPLVPCPGCARHVRAAENACPFCATALATEPALRPSTNVRGLSRAAIMVLGASLSLTGCGSAKQPVDPPANPTADPGPPDDDGGAAAEYGAPMPPDDDGGAAAEYGAPMPPDDDANQGGKDDPGAVKPMYGAPATIYGAPPN